MKLRDFNLTPPLKASIDQPIGELMTMGSEINAAVVELANKLGDFCKQSETDLSYDSIDRVMTAVCSSHGCKGRELHDQFVTKHGMTPDEYARTLFRDSRTTKLDDSDVYEQMQPGDVLMIEDLKEAVVGTVLSIDGDMIILEGGIYPLDEEDLQNNTLSEFVRDPESERDDSGKPEFMEWQDFISAVANLTKSDFDVKQGFKNKKLEKTQVVAKFIPHDPYAHGPVMLYAFKDRRPPFRIGIKANMQVGTYTQHKDQTLTQYQIPKNNLRSVDMTPANATMIAHAIMKNTSGALKADMDEAANAAQQAAIAIAKKDAHKVKEGFNKDEFNQIIAQLQHQDVSEAMWPFGKKVAPVSAPKRWPDRDDDLEQWMRDKIAHYKSKGWDPAVFFSPAAGDYFPIYFATGFSYNDAAKQAYRNIKREFPDLVKRAREEISTPLAMRVSQSRVGDHEDWPKDTPAVYEAIWPFGKKAAATPAAAPVKPAAAPAAAAPTGAKVTYKGEKYEKQSDGMWDGASGTGIPKNFPEWKAIEAEYAKSGQAPAAGRDPYVTQYGQDILKMGFFGNKQNKLKAINDLLYPGRNGSRASGVVIPFPNGKFYEINWNQGGLSIKPSKETQQGIYRWSNSIDGKSRERGNFEPRPSLDEAEYHGHQVQLGKPSKGDVKKFRVYVKDPKTGNIKKVNFGDPNMEIKRDDPERRKNFRARHGCGTPRASDRTKAAYWSCRMWSSKPVSKILKGK